MNLAALEALCVISNALNRLEVGELSVMSYGSTTSIVHPFGAPFTAQAAAQV